MKSCIHTIIPKLVCDLQVGDEESDEVGGHEIKDGVLDVHLGDNVPVRKVQHIVGRHYLVEGVLWHKRTPIEWTSIE